MATKLDSETLAKAADDEPIFVLRAQDVLAPEVIEHWAAYAELLDVNPVKIKEARLVARQMREWQEHRGKKVPD